MTEITPQETLLEAKLTAIEDGLAEFIFVGDSNNNQNTGEDEEANIFFWPEERLPEGIQVGDEILVSLDFKNKEERLIQLKKKKENQAKHEEMRKLLEELVN